MRCPTCRKEFHPQPDEQQCYLFETPKAPRINGFQILIQLCPSCKEPLIIYQEGAAGSMSDELYEVSTEEVVYPHKPQSQIPDEVPEPYQKEFEEALTALEYSPKASAALSRRLLQKTLREQLGIRKKDLSLEIDEFIEKAGAPTYLTDAVDAIRSVGNFAAHPLKNSNTGEIVDVENGEAEWLLEVLASLFDFTFVQPQRLKIRRDTLNEKLRTMGKPELKSA